MKKPKRARNPDFMGVYRNVVRSEGVFAAFIRQDGVDIPRGDLPEMRKEEFASYCNTVEREYRFEGGIDAYGYQYVRVYRKGNH
jgi:hypothetical protein